MWLAPLPRRDLLTIIPAVVWAWPISLSGSALLQSRVSYVSIVTSLPYRIYRSFPAEVGFLFISAKGGVTNMQCGQAINCTWACQSVSLWDASKSLSYYLVIVVWDALWEPQPKSTDRVFCDTEKETHTLLRITHHPDQSESRWTCSSFRDDGCRWRHATVSWGVPSLFPVIPIPAAAERRRLQWVVCWKTAEQ